MVLLVPARGSSFALTEAGITVYEASHELFEAVDRFYLVTQRGRAENPPISRSG